MNILSDTGRMAGATPPCPAWCTFPPDHDLPELTGERTRLVRREHTCVVLDAPGVAWVELFRLDTSVGAEGPTVVGPHLVQVTSVGVDLPASSARLLAEALLRAADLVDRADGGRR